MMVMSDEQKQDIASESQQVVNGDVDKLPDWVKDPARAYDAIRQTREEAKTNRQLAQELERRLSEYEARERARVEEEAKKRGDFETLLAQREKELAEIKAQAEAERLNAMRLRIGAEAGLPTALVERLKGANEAELRADAEALKAVIPTPETKKQGSTTVTAPAQGARTGETYEERRRRIYGARRGNGGTTFG